MTDPLQIIDIVGNIAGLGALGVFIILGYRVFQQSVDRSRAVDDDTIATLRNLVGESAEREDKLRGRIDDLEGKVGELGEQFEACKLQLFAVQAYMKLNHGVDPDEITGTPI